jgi:predicted nucleotidyltransferase
MTDATLPIAVSMAEIANLCRRYRIRELSLFGSALRDDFGPDSDLDLLVEVEPGSRATFITLGQLEEELEALVGRPVDLVPKQGLKRIVRDVVLSSARVLYPVGHARPAAER